MTSNGSAFALDADASQGEAPARARAASIGHTEREHAVRSNHKPFQVESSVHAIQQSRGA